MHLLAPAYLHLLWLALVPLVLWLFRRRAKRIQVSTLLFFRTLAKEHSESAWLRQIKRWISLAFTLLVILFAVLALARPARDAADGSPGAVVVMIDCSASMAALDGQTSRLDDAKRIARERLLGLPDSVVASLIAFADKPSVLLSRSRNRREFLRLLDSLEVTPAEGNTASALVVARRLAALESPAQIWHIGDEPSAELSAKGYSFTDVSLTKLTNVGITAFQLRKAPLSRDRYEGFVKVSAAAGNANPVQATLEARIGGRIAQLREIELKPGESTSLILPLEGLRGEMMEIELKCPEDCLGWDNAVIAPLPELKPLVVAWFSEKPDPFTELAMGSLVDAGHLEILRGDSKQWPLKDAPDVYVFENWVPPTWPTDRPAIALMPPSDIGSVQAKALAQSVPCDVIRSVSAGHPVVYRVDTARLSLTQTTLLSPSSALETLWMAGSEPVLAAGEINGQRTVITAFSPSRSEQLALLPAYPLLLGNALYWCAENSDALSDLKPRHPGDVLTANAPLQWHLWNGHSFTTATDEPQNGLVELRRIGAWELDDHHAGACVLASSTETNVPRKDNHADILSETSKTTAPAFASGMSWPQMLLWVVLSLLLVESFLFHRKAVY